MKKLLLLIIPILLFSCTSQEDIDNFVGDYEGSYNGYYRVTVGLSYEQEPFKGTETFSIIYEGDGNNVKLLIEDQEVAGKIRNKRASFDDYYIIEKNEETGQKSITSYYMQGKLKNGEFHYGAIISGTAMIENYALPIEGFLEGRARKIN
ncbi:hypothetical protein LJC25_00160 [Bacteroidales bacterium OttesenSCG-928-K03]|nr:hypothetical protein [Bacteroidales bacterium OttesenSCG-928-L14]MDL2241239.1 hypothetical protein [Bacteroidales bacterium OttesenSCG-928-K22]MDL2242131.1 hypothetical protein [Bacteroidales bacterium OttesenSCG-928-K03]